MAWGLHRAQPEQIERLLANNFEVCITSYEMVLLEKSALKKLPWQYIIIDEVRRRPTPARTCPHLCGQCH